MSLEGKAIGTGELSQFRTALQNGFAYTPTQHIQPTEEERNAQIAIISRVICQQYNLHQNKPILHWKSIYFRVIEVIKKEAQLGIWKHKIPEIESVRRNINYSADVRRYPDGITDSVCCTPGNYCFNPAKLLDFETREKLLKIIEESKH